MSEHSFITASVVYFASFHHNEFWRDCMFSKLFFNGLCSLLEFWQESIQSRHRVAQGWEKPEGPNTTYTCNRAAHKSPHPSEKPSSWGAQDPLRGDKSGIKPILHISSLSNYWYLGPELFLNEGVKAGWFTIQWCINKPRMANKINKSLSVSLSMALKCSCIDTIKMQLFQLLTAPWDVQLWKKKGIKYPNSVAPETQVCFFFPKLHCRRKYLRQIA